MTSLESVVHYEYTQIFSYEFPLQVEKYVRDNLLDPGHSVGHHFTDGTHQEERAGYNHRYHYDRNATHLTHGVVGNCGRHNCSDSYRIALKERTGRAHNRELCAPDCVGNRSERSVP